MLSLAEYLAYRGKRKLYVLIGACKKEHILCEREFNKLGAEVLISTEDGSKGHKGLVTDLLRKIVIASPGGAKQSRFKLLRRRFTPPRNDIVTTIYTCGPVGMLKTVAEIARRNRIPCQVSLEERMACGVGVCLGCPVKVVPSPARGGKHGKRPVPPRAGKATNHEYKMVCKDGPVFNAEEIVW